MLIFSENIIHWLESHQLPCLIRSITHVDCPGCGLQRSFISLMRGDIIQSFHFYPALIPMIIFFVFLLIQNKFRFKYGSIFIKTGMASIFITILVSYILKLTN